MEGRNIRYAVDLAVIAMYVSDDRLACNTDTDAETDTEASTPLGFAPLVISKRQRS